jgi:Helix-turn-helix domain
MTGVAPHERLRRARAERGEDVEALSARTGLRPHHVRAIEEARFADLPPGIYGRAAIRTFAAAYALDSEEVLADCEPLLPRLEDPISALARSHGMVSAPTQSPAEPARAAIAATTLTWRPFGAASLDGAIAGALLLTVSAGTALLARVSLAALSSSGVSLFLVGLVLGSAYYVWLGGLGGTTFGEYAVGPAHRRRDPRPLTLRAIALRTIAAATADARAIHACGQWTGQRLRRGGGRSAPPPEPSPSPPRLPDREELLTWSMSRRASVPPPRLRPRRG